MTKPRTRAPVAPKTQAAAGGAGTGALLAALAVSLIETYWTHKALPAATVQAIYAIVPLVLAFAASYAAPHQVRPADNAEWRALLDEWRAELAGYRSAYPLPAIEAGPPASAAPAGWIEAGPPASAAPATPIGPPIGSGPPVTGTAAAPPSGAGPVIPSPTGPVSG